MAIHRFKCSDELNKEIMSFSDIHKFDSKENLIEQFDLAAKRNSSRIPPWCHTRPDSLRAHR